jgi:hypothetical protein
MRLRAFPALREKKGMTLAKPQSRQEFFLCACPPRRTGLCAFARQKNN